MTPKSPNLGSHEFNHILSLSSLFEKEFSIDWLLDLTHSKASLIISAIEEGVLQGWLKGNGRGIYSFADAKKRKICQGLLNSEEQMLFHRVIVETLIKDLPDDVHKARSLAYHLLFLRNDKLGCRWLLKAGDIYLKTYRPENALKCYKKILDDLSRKKGKELDSIFIEVAIKYSKISTARHDTKNVLSVLNEGITRAKHLNEKKCQALLEMHLAKNEWLRSNYRTALRRFEKGWSIANELNDPALLRSATNFRTFFLYWQGRFQEAVTTYEKVIPDVDKFPKGRFPLLASLTVGHCYAQIGQVTQGLGMLDAAYRRCLEKGDLYLASNAGVTMGAIMVDVRLLHEALECLEPAIENAKISHNDFMHIFGMLVLSYAYFLIDDRKRCQANLQKFLNHSRHVHVTVRLFPYFLELCWAMKQGKLPHISGLELENEILLMTKGKNVFMKGIAYKIRALLQEQMGLRNRAIIQSYKLSLKWLKKSGQLVELARLQLELARYYLSFGDEYKVEEMTKRAAKILSSLNEKMVPVDLRYLTKKEPFKESLLNEIFDLNKELISVKDNKEFIHRVLTTVNLFTGAERGALFLLENEGYPPRFKMTASRNLDHEEITRSSFHSSIKMIEDVANSGKACILRDSLPKGTETFSDGVISSRICAPVRVKDRVIGVLYHDNRLLSGVFDESDLEVISYFVSLAAFATEHKRACEEIDRLHLKINEVEPRTDKGQPEKKDVEGILGESSATRTIIEQIHKVANTDSTVMIIGESGVGKELVAKAIYRKSERSDKPFICTNCSAFPETLIASEMFGYEKGAFTGAIRQRKGRFELADGGTLFLDEVSTLPLEMQIMLLRVLQNKKFERLGGSETIHSDFRLITATNRDLKEEIKKNTFRLDLYYRLNVFSIYIPPLRERPDDIPLIAEHFLKIYGAKAGKSFYPIPSGEIEKLLKYDWPGNIRELENVIERGTILSPDYQYKMPDLELNSSKPIQNMADLTLKGNDRRHILWALQRTEWKIRGQGGAAEILDLPPSTLEFKMKKLDIKRPPGLRRKRRNFR